jgi:hypothetical protein
MAESQGLNASAMILESLRGLVVTSLNHFAEDAWDLNFNFHAADLNIYCSWRLVGNGLVLLGGSDHGQKFGLPEPVDVMAEALRLLNRKAVEEASIDETTADLRIDFAGDMRVDVFNDSGTHEGWTFADKRGLKIVPQGGGQKAIWKPIAPKP